MFFNNFIPLLIVVTGSMAFVILTDPPVNKHVNNNIQGQKTCPENEFIPQDCNPHEQTCNNPNPTPLKGCPKTGVCQCLPNFYRFNGICVPAADCPSDSNALLRARKVQSLNSCQLNEQWYGCGRIETTCTSNLLTRMMINMWCRPSGCYCASGFVREPTLGCILAEECPKTNKTISHPTDKQ